MAQEKQETSVRKEQILQASAEIINNLGVRGLSISAIAKAVGLVPSAIYRHFENKGEIVKEIVKSFSHKLTQIADNAKEQEVNPLSRVKKILNMHAQLLLQNKFFPMLMFSEEVSLDDFNLKTEFTQTIGKFLGRIAENFREAKDQGLIRQDISDQHLTLMYLGLFLPIAASLVVLGQETDVISLVEANWKVFISGVKPR